MREIVSTAAEIDAMSERTYQVYENSLFWAARRQGLRLEKSHVRDPRGYDYGAFGLVESPPATPGRGNRRGPLNVAKDEQTSNELPIAEVHEIGLEG